MLATTSDGCPPTRLTVSAIFIRVVRRIPSDAWHCVRELELPWEDEADGRDKKRPSPSPNRDATVDVGTPTAPVDPAVPTTAGGPVAPVAPAVPVAPVAPVAPSAQPVVPVASVASVLPTEPVPPSEPVPPTEPVPPPASAASSQQPRPTTRSASRAPSVPPSDSAPPRVPPNTPSSTAPTKANCQPARKKDKASKTSTPAPVLERQEDEAVLEEW